MVQKTRKTLGFKKIMVCKIPPGGVEVNHIWPLVYNWKRSKWAQTNTERDTSKSKKGQKQTIST